METIPPNSVIAAEQAPGGPLLGDPKADPCAVVIFGVTGDLAKRKLVPALYNLMADGSLPEKIGIVGVTRAGISSDEQRNRFRESTAQLGRRKSVDDTVWSKFAGALDFVNGQIDDPKTYADLKEKLALIDREKGTQGNRIFYLATPPEAFAVILENLREGRAPLGPTPKPPSPGRGWSSKSPSAVISNPRTL